VLAEETKQFIVRGLGAIVDEPTIDTQSA